MTLPVLVLTPHPSGYIPPDILAEMLGEDFFSFEKRNQRISWMFDEGDPYTDVIYHCPDAYNLHALTSRFVVDLNRERDQDGENGIIKLTDFEKRPLYPEGFVLSEEKRQERLRRYYDSFHNEVEFMLEQYPIKLIIDGHSMQPQGPKIGPDAGKLRPAITLMTSSTPQGKILNGKTHSTISLEQAHQVMGLLEKHFMPIIEDCNAVPAFIALNEPWDHDEISYRYSDPNRKNHVPAFAIEFNRALYLHYGDGREYPNEPVIKKLNQTFQEFIREVVTIVN
jgi:N-formylglutamate amidohydrolase